MIGGNHTRVQICRHCKVPIAFNPGLSMWVSCTKPRSLTCNDNSIHEIDSEQAIQNMLYVVRRSEWQDIR
jgi:hypothetical protein